MMNRCWLKSIGLDMFDPVTGLCKVTTRSIESQEMLGYNIDCCPNVIIHNKDYDTPYYCKLYPHPEAENPSPRTNEEFAELCARIDGCDTEGIKKFKVR